MKTIIVVDAWKNCLEKDVLMFPFLEKETKSFGQYLNVCLSNLRNNYKIVHCPGDRTIMEEIDTSSDQIISSVDVLDKEGEYYFCGFHLGRCIQRKYRELEAENKKIIYNLSLLFPADTLNNIDKSLNYCYYTYKGFTDVQI